MTADEAGARATPEGAGPANAAGGDGLGDDVSDRPLFARGYPRTPEIDALLAAFDAGNYARVRAEAPRLAESTTDPKVAAAARDLRKRIEPDPLQLYLLALTAALLAFLTAWFFWHKH